MSDDLFKDSSLLDSLESIHGTGTEPTPAPAREEVAPPPAIPVDVANVEEGGEMVTLTDRLYTDTKLVLKPNGHIKELYIHQSLIKKFIHRGTMRDYCPLQLYMTYVTGKLKFRPSKYMLNGLYFEAGALNNGIDKDGNVIQLERLRNGKKSTENLRIDEQIFNFKENVSKQLGLTIGPGTIWRQFNAEVHNKSVTDAVPFSVFVELETDLLSPIEYKHFKDELAIIDLKLTGDRNGCFGEFCWGEPENMDHIQAYLYSFTLKIPFYYVVMDYKPQDRGWKLVPVNTDMHHPDPKTADEARKRYREMFQSIRTVAVQIEDHHKHGWKTNPNPDNCKGCPVLDCKDRTAIKTI